MCDTRKNEQRQENVYPAYTDRNRLKHIEASLRTKYKHKIFNKFVQAICDFDLVRPDDKIAVCISGGKDSMLMAKLFQELKSLAWIRVIQNETGSKSNLMPRCLTFLSFFLIQKYLMRFLTWNRTLAICVPKCAVAFCTGTPKRRDAIKLRWAITSTISSKQVS